MPAAHEQGFITVDDEGRVVVSDDAAEEILGLESAEMSGRLITELLTPQRLRTDRWTCLRRVPNGTQIELALRHVVDPHDTAADSALLTLLDSTEAMAQIGVWDWDLESGEVRWSDNLFCVLGLEPGEEAPTMDSLIARVHPDDRELLKGGIASARRGQSSGPFELRAVRSVGDPHRIQTIQVSVVRAGGRLLGSVQDITEWRRAERQLATHLAISEALAEWQTLEQGAQGVLRNLAQGLECLVGVLWLPEGDVLSASAIWTSGDTTVGELERVVRQLRLPAGVGLAGQVWQKAEPAAVTSLEQDPRFPPASVANVRGAVAVPAGDGEEVLAVLEFYFCESVDAEAPDRLLRSLGGIGYELGLFLAHRRGELSPTTLTPREHDVLQLAAEGCSGPEIADRLVVSPATVRSHFENIYEKYGVSDRAAAVAKAFREGHLR